jgi:hypothetical protein
LSGVTTLTCGIADEPVASVQPPSRLLVNALKNAPAGMTCWRRLRDWHQAGVWQELHEALLAEVNAAGALDWSRAVIDSSHERAMEGGPKQGRARLTMPGLAPSIT